ncbi:secretion activator protein [Pseudoalteromonas sp. S1609]|uniref:glycoside hydrolase family 108 protein n=1 Tax=Pseudoalteromonas sp. S1609 TaxID=579505 RepID=UPI00110A0B97|nr:glycosyl hydrolase 108 family protein [Pseudoalteromonas sp. S1609]TMP70231.1 secretion activator protein [Pseudoalteromonas sp. S1609]
MFVFNPLNLNYFKQVPEVQNALAPYSLKFAQCILPILYLEGGLRSDGGLNNVASDRGGLTKYGISQRAYPTVDIKNLTLAKALSLYHSDYWRAMHCEQSPAGVDFMLLDGAVQHGAPAMTQLTQRLVNSKPDGRMGPKTLAAILQRPALSLTVLLSVNRGRKYARICANDSSQKPNLEGWYNRLAHVTEFAVNQLSGVA